MFRCYMRIREKMVIYKNVVHPQKVVLVGSCLPIPITTRFHRHGHVRVLLQGFGMQADKMDNGQMSGCVDANRPLRCGDWDFSFIAAFSDSRFQTWKHVRLVGRPAQWQLSHLLKPAAEQHGAQKGNHWGQIATPRFDHSSMTSWTLSMIARTQEPFNVKIYWNEITWKRVKKLTLRKNYDIFEFGVKSTVPIYRYDFPIIIMRFDSC